MSTTVSNAFTRTFTDDGEVALADVGGKGFGLIEMARSGLRVPPGYVIGTAACHEYLAHDRLPDSLNNEVFDQLSGVEQKTGKTFGAGPTPLLLSVRSGAPVSMPGMMDTILNLGINRQAAIALAESTGDLTFVGDVVFRFHTMYSEIVLGAFDAPDRSDLDELLEELGEEADPGTAFDAVWKLCADRLAEDMDDEVPTDPREQLIGAIEAVFRSWNTRRAQTYRKVHKIPDSLGTAVVVQSMAFGNLDEKSGSGVVFTRNPITGEPGMYGEFLCASQGEDVVSGVRTPEPVASMIQLIPEAYEELVAICETLENSRQDMLDIEFTVEKSTLYMLQVRSAKRTAQAALRCTVDMHDEGVLDAESAFRAVSLEQIREAQRPTFDPDELARARVDDRILTVGVGACPGNVVGQLHFDSDLAERAAQQGTPVILARPITSPTDLHGMIAAQGIITATGGATSHAAVVARALGTTCIVGCAQLDIDPEDGSMRVAGRTFRTGDIVSLEGSSGEVFEGSLDLVQGAVGEQLDRFLDIAIPSDLSTSVFGRAHSSSQVEDALERGAVGVVSAIDDVLATTGSLNDIINAIEQGKTLAEAAETLRKAIAAAFRPILQAVGKAQLSVRGLDFHADDVAELFALRNLFALHPQLAMPLGCPEFLTAQLRGLAEAAEGTSAQVVYVSPRTNGRGEAEALRRLAAELPNPIGIGCYITNVQGMRDAAGIAENVDSVWIELRRIQAATFDIPSRHLITAEPLDSYVGAGLLPLDPRVDVDDFVLSLLDQMLVDVPDISAVGVRLTGDVTVGAVDMLHTRGIRQYAVKIDEVRPTRLALAQQ